MAQERERVGGALEGIRAATEVAEERMDVEEEGSEWDSLPMPSLRRRGPLKGCGGRGGAKEDEEDGWFYGKVAVPMTSLETKAIGGSTQLTEQEAYRAGGLPGKRKHASLSAVRRAHHRWFLVFQCSLTLTSLRCGVGRHAQHWLSCARLSPDSTLLPIKSISVHSKEGELEMGGV